METLYTLREASEMLRVSLSTIRLWKNHNKLETIKMGRKILVRASTIEKMIEEGFDL